MTVVSRKVTRNSRSGIRQERESKEVLAAGTLAEGPRFFHADGGVRIRHQIISVPPMWLGQYLASNNINSMYMVGSEFGIKQHQFHKEMQKVKKLSMQKVKSEFGIKPHHFQTDGGVRI